MGATTALIAALGVAPMAKAAGGFLIAPIVSGLLGILVWREPPTATRLAGSAVSFAGAALLRAQRPASSPAALFALDRRRAPRRLPRRHRGARRRPTRSRRSRSVAPRRGAPRPLRPRRRPAGADPGLLLGALALGAISAVCHSSPSPPTSAPTRPLAPFLYFNLLTAMAVGFLFFGEALGWTSIAGLFSSRLRGRSP